MSEIAQSSRTTLEVTREVLTELAGVEDSTNQRFGPSLRFRLASIAVGLGAVDRVARALTWQEFEGFSEECLSRASFKTWKGMVFHDGTRRWQIDIAATKNQILLAFDCKHWASPGYASKFKSAIEHQKQSIGPLVQYLRRDDQLAKTRIWALPAIVTLFEPRESLIDGAVIVSTGQLQDFLEHITPFDPELPFTAFDETAETL